MWAVHVFSVMCQVSCKSTPSRLLPRHRYNNISTLPMNREGGSPATSHTANTQGDRASARPCASKARDLPPHLAAALDPQAATQASGEAGRTGHHSNMYQLFTSEGTSAHSSVLCLTAFLAFIHTSGKQPLHGPMSSQDRFPQTMSTGQSPCACFFILDLPLTKLMLGQLARRTW